jgi:PAS domain S-box-containing protein
VETVVEIAMVFRNTALLNTIRKAKRYFLLVIIGLFQIVPIPSADAARIVTVGLYNNKPLVFIDDAGEPQGIFVDLLEHIAAREKWRLEYVPGSWSDCLDRLESGNIDLLAALAYSDERAKKFDYTYETVITNWAQVFVRRNSELRSLLELDAKKIAAKMDDIHLLGIRDLTSKFNMQCRIIEADEYDTVFELIEAGRVQAGVVNRIFGIQNKVNYLVQETPIMFDPIEVRYAAPKSLSVDLLSTIDIHLRKMHTEKDPFYTQTMNRWLVSQSEWVLPGWVKYALAGIGFALLMFAAMNFTLRIKVNKRTKALYCANNKLNEEIQIRQRAEEALHKYAKIVASSTDHMAMIDLSYAYQAINDAALKAINKRREEVLGRKIWEILGDVFEAEHYRQSWDRAFSGHVVKDRAWMDFPIIGKRYMDIVLTPYTHADNSIAGCVVNARDNTERYELELKLKNAQKMEFMGTIAGGVAHDLNNILSGIVSYPELLLMQLPKESPLADPINLIKKSGEKAAVIVQDLLTLARRGVANKQPVDLNEIISLFLMSPECSEIQSRHQNVRIRTAMADQLNTLSGSSVHLSKTVMNLVLNAAEAMPDGGQITITTRNLDRDDSVAGANDALEGDYVLLEVEDTGMGICEEDRQRIFEPFYTKKVMGRSGTGLGLAVVWGTVIDHHGHIEVDSDGKNGTAFRLYFPVSHEKAASIAPINEIHKYKGNGDTILLVDDMEEQRVIASNILSELGYSVASVPSGEDAISFLHQNSMDLVILDMLMPPGMDGLETYQELLKINPNQKAIIASGFAENDRIKEAIDLGVSQCIKKPYTISEVGSVVKTILMS